MHLPAAPTRRFRITFRISADERARIEAGAVRAGLRLSGYARAALVQAKPLRASRRPPVEVSLLSHALAQLGAVATSLRRVAGACILTPVAEREIMRLLSELARVLARVMKALGRKAARP